MSEFTVQKLSEIVIHVTDVERSLKFYRNLLGLKETFSENGMAWLAVGQSESSVTILLHESDIAQPVDKGIAIDFLVDNLDLAVKSIRKAGYEIVQEPIKREWGVIEAVVKDPDGYKIWLLENI